MSLKVTNGSENSFNCGSKDTKVALSLSYKTCQSQLTSCARYRKYWWRLCASRNLIQTYWEISPIFPLAYIWYLTTRNKFVEASEWNVELRRDGWRCKRPRESMKVWKLNEWINERMNEWNNNWLNEQTNEWINEWIDERKKLTPLAWN